MTVFTGVQLPRILVVEDDEDLCDLLRYVLEKEGYWVDIVLHGDAVLSAVASSPPHLILLDVMLPGKDGFTICELLKKSHEKIPVIMLTARGQEADIVRGLDAGACDYVVKPFSPKILLARIRAAMRLTASPRQTPSPSVLIFETLSIDGERFEARVQGVPVPLSAQEFGILLFLATHKGRVLSRDRIIDAVKGSGHAVEERTVDVQVASLRRKLGSVAGHIETVRGVGYRFREKLPDTET